MWNLHKFVHTCHIVLRTIAPSDIMWLQRAMRTTEHYVLGKEEKQMYTGSGIIKIFAGSTGKPFAKRMCAYLGTQLGDAETIKFSEGNIFVRVNESIRDKDVYIVQPIGRQPNDEFVELLFWIDAFKRASANSVTAIIPYFSYAKGDKKDEPRVSIRARV